MIVTFDEVEILDVYQGTSKAGQPFGTVKMFLPEEHELYELLFFGSDVQALSSLQPNSHIKKISFRLKPNSRNGVRLIPAW